MAPHVCSGAAIIEIDSWEGPKFGGFFGKRIVLQIYFVLITCIFLLRFIFAFPKIKALIFLQILKGSQTRPKAFPQCKLQQSSSSESSTNTSAVFGHGFDSDLNLQCLG